MRYWSAIVAVGALALTLAGCGVSGQSRAQPLNIASASLHAPAAGSSSSATASGGDLVVFLDGSGRLVPVVRHASRPDPAAALGLLERSPTAFEAVSGLTNPASGASPLRVTSMKKGVVTVALPKSFTSLGGQTQIIAIAQIVFTVTEFPGIRQVALTVAGSRAEVPTPDGTLVRGTVSRTDYAALAPK